MIALTIVAVLGWLAAIFFFALFMNDGDDWFDRTVGRQVRIRLEDREKVTEQAVLGVIERNKKQIKATLR